MTALDWLYNVILAVGMVSAFVMVATTIRKVPRWWKPLYWVALPLALFPVLIVIIVALQEFTDLHLFPQRAGLTLLKITLMLLVVQLHAVPLIHRYETKRLGRGSEDAK